MKLSAGTGSNKDANVVRRQLHTSAVESFKLVIESEVERNTADIGCDVKRLCN